MLTGISDIADGGALAKRVGKFNAPNALGADARPLKSALIHGTADIERVGFKDPLSLGELRLRGGTVCEPGRGGDPIGKFIDPGLERVGLECVVLRTQLPSSCFTSGCLPLVGGMFGEELDSEGIATFVLSEPGVSEALGNTPAEVDCTAKPVSTGEEDFKRPRSKGPGGMLASLAPDRLMTADGSTVRC